MGLALLCIRRFIQNSVFGIPVLVPEVAMTTAMTMPVATTLPRTGLRHRKGFQRRWSWTLQASLLFWDNTQTLCCFRLTWRLSELASSRILYFNQMFFAIDVSVQRVLV